MSDTLNKVLDILTYVMIGLTAIFVAFFYMGGEVVKDTPVYTDLLLNWAFVLFLISIGLSLFFPIVQLFVNPKGALKGLAGVAGLGLIILISYSMSDGTLLDMPGYTGPDNNPDTLKFADTVLYTMYALGIGTVGSIVVTEILRKLR